MKINASVDVTKFENLTAVKMMMVVWVVKPCALAGRYQCFRRMYFLHF
jgi:hypothetical protein